MVIAASDFAQEDWYSPGRGPRYLQLHHHISAAIQSGRLAPNDQLPAEREMAEMADISRVTVRKAVAQLVSEGLIEQRRGAGSFVRASGAKLEQSLSSLISFTENMQARGMSSSSKILASGLFAPTPEEIVALGLSANDSVSRVKRLRSAGNTPMAIELSSLPIDILPDPTKVGTSLYEILRSTGKAPTRAIQQVTAINLKAPEAALLQLPQGTAVLKIDRTGYLASRRPIEFTSGLYRSDTYHFVSELRRD